MNPSVTDWKRPDTSSIKTTTLLSFVLFAMMLVVIIWAFVAIFIDTYYEKMRMRETVNIADELEENYLQNPNAFQRRALQTASSNFIYIHMDTGFTTIIADGVSVVEPVEYFNDDAIDIKAKLASSDKNSMLKTIKGVGPDSEDRFIYAKKIGGHDSPTMLCIISPIFPDALTTKFIKNLLVYISGIILLIGIFMAFALSHKLSSPIEALTIAATEMSKGNYNVKFNGSGFTETKKLAQALNKASYEMEKTDFYQKEIIANVSHDLKTPLTMIRSYAEKIIDISGDNTEKRNSDLAVIISETERLNRLVTDMMSVSNLQSNNVVLNKEIFNIVEAAEDVFESFQILATSDEFEMHFHPCKPTYVLGDRTRLMQVMANFISNAVKYSEDNKYVDIRIARIGKKVGFHCIDHGVGIPSDELQHVWDRYYRASVSHARDIDGSGLGLSIVKGILSLHSASYGVDSEEGKGSDFWFEIDTVRKPAQSHGNKQTTDTTIEIDKINN